MYSAPWYITDMRTETLDTLTMAARVYRSGYFLHTISNVASWPAAEYTIGKRQTEVAKLMQEHEEVAWKVVDSRGQIVEMGRNKNRKVLGHT